MLDFGVQLNNTEYLMELEKAPLWKYVSKVAQEARHHSRDLASPLCLLPYLVRDWASKYGQDHFGNSSIYARLLAEIKVKAPPELKADLEASPLVEPQQPIKQLIVETKPELSPKKYFLHLFRVRMSHTARRGLRKEPQVIAILHRARLRLCGNQPGVVGPGARPLGQPVASQRPDGDR